MKRPIVRSGAQLRNYQTSQLPNYPTSQQLNYLRAPAYILLYMESVRRLTETAWLLEEAWMKYPSPRYIPVWLILPLLLAKYTRSPGSSWSVMGTPHAICSAAVRGRPIPSDEKQCCTKAEQSNPAAVVPPKRYGTPRYRYASFNSALCPEPRTCIPPRDEICV